MILYLSALRADNPCSTLYTGGHRQVSGAEFQSTEGVVSVFCIKHHLVPVAEEELNKQLWSSKAPQTEEVLGKC